MNTSKALVPSTITQRSNLALTSLLSVIAGVGLLALCAQIKIPLSWTPVPVTGQTFGVALLALLWGSRLSLATFTTYLVVGFLGAPVFAGGVSGLLIGPTFGYLIGMMFASWLIGKLSDVGWSRNFLKALGACYVGSLVTFTCGIIGLSFFIPADKLLMAGVIPFLPGDLIKNILAAFTTSRLPLKE
jgi:biotin transport system substrate-specific component